MSRRKTAWKSGGNLKEPGNGDLGKLFLSLINITVTIEKASGISGLKIEKVAEIISSPFSEQFFSKDNNNELTIKCRYDWFSENLIQQLNLKKDEKKMLEDIIFTKLPSHLKKYWNEDGHVKRDLNSRTVQEWITSELAFLAGFCLWFREKETKGKIDLSMLISSATGDKVKASGEIEFDRERLELLRKLPSKTLTLLRDISPAGKIAYRSMDMAIIKGISEGNEDYANSMKERTQTKPWWKFW